MFSCRVRHRGGSMNDSNIQDLVTGIENSNITASIKIGRRRSDTPKASIVVRARQGSVSSQDSQTASVDRSKKKIHPKVRTGCDTCKRRKIKCDETKPFCLRCTKGGRQCEGYHPPQAKLFEPHSRPERHESINENRSLDYFREHTAKRMSAYRPLQLQDEFWFDLCPRMAAELPAVKHALIALSATSEKYEAKYLRKAPSEEVRERTMFALEQYTKALRELGSSIGDSSISAEATLICCVLLASCDFWHTGIPLTFDHAFAGLRICQTLQGSNAEASGTKDLGIRGKELLPAFEHLTSCASTILEDLSPDKASLVSGHINKLEIGIPAHFIDLPAAFTVMDAILRHIAQLPSAHPTSEIERINLYLAKLLEALESSLTLPQHVEDMSANFGFRSLLVHQRIAHIIANTFDKVDETIYDNYKTDFEFAVSEIESLLTMQAADSSLQIEHVNCWQGVIPPLFFIATKCRDSVLRHRAIRALHLAPHTERMWTTCSASQIAREIAWLEEQGIPREANADASSGPRIKLNHVQFDTIHNTITLNYERQNVKGPKYALSTISWEKDAEIDAFDVPQIISISQRYIRVAGYAPLIMTFRGIGCHCRGKLSATQHNVLLKSTPD